VGGLCVNKETTIFTWTEKEVRVERTLSGTDSGRKSGRRRCTPSDTRGWS